MTMPRFFSALVVALIVQAGVFALRYDDLLYLRRAPDAIGKDAPSTFAVNAAQALARPDLTRQHLDTIADAARRLGESAFEVRALERRLEMDPMDHQVRLRLADALRRAGRLEEAEAMYLDVARPVRNEER